MSSLSFGTLPLISVTLLLSLPLAILADSQENFVQCLSKDPTISPLLYTPNSPNYSSVLQFSLRNSVFNTSTTPKPHVIVTPTNISQVQVVILCSKKTGLRLRVRSGGHDYEGLSYVCRFPFVILDLINLAEINVDVANKYAWVQAGASVGQVYYRIAEKSKTLAFPAGVCPTIGVGGHLSGGGYGFLLRKYGLSVDNIIDAQLVDVNGIILNRASMGEDLFWAIRGGGGNTFGVVIAWKIRLVPVPATVTAFKVKRTLEQNATQIVNRWQYIANKFKKDLFVRITVSRVTSSAGKTTIQAEFQSLFLGGVDKLLPLMRKRFPELGLLKKDCNKMSWIQSVLFIYGLPINSTKVLLDRASSFSSFYKIKSDYVNKPLPEAAIEGIWKLFSQVDASGNPQLVLTPYGGVMSEISESSIPFPHRAGNIYKIQELIYWTDESNAAASRYLHWSRLLHKYLTPYVSSNPRKAYLNYRDLDIGRNDQDGNATYDQARIWGVKYFNNNFDRLVLVKIKFDPTNFFRNEQSVPPELP